MVQGIGPSWLCPSPFGFSPSPFDPAQQFGLGLGLGLGLAETVLDAFMKAADRARSMGCPRSKHRASEARDSAGLRARRAWTHAAHAKC
jgi:hypothetical protein